MHPENQKNVTMKNLALLITSCFFVLGATNCYGQVEQGNLLIGGHLSFDQSKYSQTRFDHGTETDNIEQSITSYAIRPEGGYFIQDQWAVGMGLTYSHFSRSREDVALNDSITSDVSAGNTSYSINPFGRYYVDLGSNFYFFGELEAHYSIGETGEDFEDSERNREMEYTNIGASLRPGLTFFVTDHIGLYFTTPTLLSFNHSIEESENTDISGETTENNTTTTELNGNFNFGDFFDPTEVSIGVNIFLN